MRSLLLLLMLSVPLIASTKPVCDVKAVTKNCSVFAGKEDQQTFKLSDGTSIKGFKAGNGTYASLASNSGNIPARSYDSYLESQDEVLEILDTVSLPTSIKLDLNNSLKGLFRNQKGSFSLHWPPDEKKPSMRFVQGEEVISFLRSKLSPENFERLQDIAKKQDESVNKAMQNNADLLLAEMNRTDVDSQARHKKTTELFKYAQDKIVEIIKRGKKDSDLTIVEKGYIEKIMTAKLEPIGGREDCAPGEENAAYTPTSHSISMCPATSNSPDSRLVLVMAHELSHAIDPCSGPAGLYKVDMSKAENMPQDLKAYAKFSEGVDYVNLNPEITSGDQRVLNEYLKSGFFRQDVPVTSAASYPFKKEYDCMTKELGFREISKNDEKATAEFIKRYLKSKRVSAESPVNTSAKQYLEALKKYPQCLRVATHVSEMTEVMSDVLGTLVAEKYISEHPAKTEMDQVGYLPMTVDACKPAQSWNAANFVSSPQVTSQYFFSKFAEPHSTDEERIKKIYMNLPSIAAMYGCRRETPKCFDHLSLVGRTSKKLEADGPKAKKEAGIR